MPEGDWVSQRSEVIRGTTEGGPCPSGPVLKGAGILNWCVRNPSFAPLVLAIFPLRKPTTCVVGCILSPLRGYK